MRLNAFRIFKNDIGEGRLPGKRNHSNTTWNRQNIYKRCFWPPPPQEIWVGKPQVIWLYRQAFYQGDRAVKKPSGFAGSNKTGCKRDSRRTLSFGRVRV